MSYKTINRLVVGAFVYGSGSYFSGLATGSGALSGLPALSGIGAYTVPSSIPVGTGALVSNLPTLTGSGSYTAPVPSGGGAVTTLQLTTSAATATYPFMAGLGFVKGEVPSATSINLSNCVGYQVIVKRRWNDGSLKHAIISGRTALTQNVAKTLNVSTGTAPTGTNLTAASIAARNPSASIQCGGHGTVNLSSLLNQTATSGNNWTGRIRDWIVGHEMAESHYRSPMGSHPNLVAFFHVRLYADNRVWIRFIVENGFLNNGGALNGNGNVSYIPTVLLDGNPVSATIHDGIHYANTRWKADAWIGGDPQITPRHNLVDLRATKLVPNYYWNSPTEGALNNITQTYTINTNGDIELHQGSVGFTPGLGWLPRWSAMYASNGEIRSWRAMLANDSMLNNYPIVWRSRTTGLVPRPSDFTTWTVHGPGGGGETVWGAGPQGPELRVWDKAHHVSAGYLSYICTGEYWYYETMQMQSLFLYLMASSLNGSGTNRATSWGNTRDVGWMIRTLSQLAAIAPDDDAVSADLKALLVFQVNRAASIAQTPGINGLGIIFAIELASGAYGGVGQIAPFQLAYFSLPWGIGWDIEPLADMGNWLIVRNQVDKTIVALLGPNGVDNYCYTIANAYTIKISDFNNADPTTFYDTGGQVYTATFGAPNTSCGSVLNTDGTTAGGTWGALLAWIAQAVEHGVPGASDSLARITNATNWPAFSASSVYPETGGGFNDMPNFGIMPRDFQFPTWRQGMVVGEARVVPNSAISSIQTAAWNDISIRGTSGPSAMLAAFSGAAYHRVLKKIYIIGNGGHGDYGGSQVLECDVGRDSSATPRWAEKIPPVIGPAVVQEGLYFNDAARTPSPAHTYRQTQICYPLNKVIRVGVRNTWGPNGGASSTDMIAYDIDSIVYDQETDQLADTPVIFNAEAGVYTDLNTNDIWVFNNHTQNVYVYRFASNTWEHVRNNAPSFDGKVGAIDSTRNRIFCCTGTQATQPFVLNMTAPYASSTVTLTGPAAAALLPAVGNEGWDMGYLPASDAYWAVPRQATTAWYRIDAATFAVTVVPLTGITTLPASDGESSGTENRACMIDPDLGGAFSLRNYAGNVIFTRFI